MSTGDDTVVYRYIHYAQYVTLVITRPVYSLCTHTQSVLSDSADMYWAIDTLE